ncbi:glycine betaine ABC transporter substrate-binding protein [Mammaliicoccus sciuri]|uniref:glycine betaine ABC transporter substrate-binding protein n=1 Tax=Mammaliicoccus sciuri TaxID=1296 RepID=UPI00226FB6AA|nr:glycine betaine ABC transporter substrate-binding protein [Mammaliicoccus sciuri]MCY1029023.1 glycine betaine ABC transporter substrate-binding protein [Mammaliicoccus sciuri]
MKNKWRVLVLMLSLALVLAACSNGGSSEDGDLGKKDINLSYVEWDSEIASTHVMQKVLEDEGYNVEITPLDNAVMWESVANGETDAMVSAWLPGTHGDLYKKHKKNLDDLGPNLKGAKIGLVVNKDFDGDSISDLKDQAGKKIVGIEPGAGVVKASEKAVKDYNLDGWKVETSSSGAMATTLGQAMKKGDDIVVTGWSPHWKFQKYDLKYLKDPKGSFGKAEHINTMARKDLKKDSPKAYETLDNFNWTTEDMESVMLDIQEGTSPKKAAEKWVDDNQDKVKEWTKDSKKDK